MSGLAFVDLETTGLDPRIHEPWEIAIITEEVERVWHVEPDLERADPNGLRVGRFYERTNQPPPFWDDTQRGTNVALEVARLLDGRHMVGAVPSFDAAFLVPFLRSRGQAPTWHCHLIDVEALAAGWLSAARPDWLASDPKESKKWAAETARPPWESDALSRAVGVDVAQFDRHTALGDARWAKAIYEAVFNDKAER